MNPSPYIGRLAPSPTGLLHLGHAATFIAAHDRARAVNGQLWLRIDDLDPQRSKEHFIEAAKEDLTWLGLTWDGEVRQSQRLALYREAMQKLLSLGAAFPCTCSRKDLQQATQAPHEDTEDEPIYTGRCRPRDPNSSEKSRTLQPDTSYRFQVPDGQIITFHDEHFGPQRFLAGSTSNAAFGDFLVWRNDGLPSYQLASVIDDADMRITEVVRGRDLLKSTARQIQLQHALKLPIPAYFHTDLLRDGNGERMAKRHDALSLRALRQSSLSPADVRSQLHGHLHLSEVR